MDRYEPGITLVASCSCLGRFRLDIDGAGVAGADLGFSQNPGSTGRNSRSNAGGDKTRGCGRQIRARIADRGEVVRCTLEEDGDARCPESGCVGSAKGDVAGDARPSAELV